jgi:ABC-type methionine transport system permease subunit
MPMRNNRISLWTGAVLQVVRANPDWVWLGIWVGGIGTLLLWDVFFLNAPALHLLLTALGNTLLAGTLVVLFALVLGWMSGTSLFVAERRGRRVTYFTVSFLVNIVRSVPQIVGMLAGYVVLTLIMERSGGIGASTLLFWMSVITAGVVFSDVTDLIRARVAQYAALDFYPAMLCSGVREGRIINIEILWKNSRAHLVHVMMSIFGMAIFLQCSIDFVLSVGLSTDVSAVNFPVTLGSLLATLDSKQDILAIGTAMTDPSYIGFLFTRHLQGVSVAFAITFTLLCVHQITDGIVRRHRL